MIHRRFVMSGIVAGSNSTVSLPQPPAGEKWRTVAIAPGSHFDRCTLSARGDYRAPRGARHPVGIGSPAYGEFDGGVVVCPPRETLANLASYLVSGSTADLDRFTLELDLFTDYMQVAATRLVKQTVYASASVGTSYALIGIFPTFGRQWCNFGFNASATCDALVGSAILLDSHDLYDATSGQGPNDAVSDAILSPDNRHTILENGTDVTATGTSGTASLAREYDRPGDYIVVAAKAQSGTAFFTCTMETD